MESQCPAFVIVDSYTRSLGCLLRPKSSFQLCGATLIEHTLDWLDRSNVDVVYLWCCNTDSFRFVPHLIGASNYSFRTVVIGPDKLMDMDDESEDGGSASANYKSKSSASLGDCLRYADTTDVLAKYAAASGNDNNRGSSRAALPDFLLMGSDIFAQQPLSSSVKRHRQWKEKDKSCVLTVVCAADTVQPVESSLCVVTDVNGRLLHWRDSVGDSQDLTLPPNLVAPKSGFGGELHVWPRIYPVAAVCSPEILVQFADNFDYETINDVIRGLLTNEEVLGQHIYIDVIDSGLKRKNFPQNAVFYVTDLMSLAYTTRSLLLSATSSRSPYTAKHLVSAFYRRFPASFVSSTASTQLSIIEGISLISEKVTFSGKPSSISSTYIGPKCSIGSRCMIEESYIAESVKVENDVVICSSFISANCTIKSGAIIDCGCVIAPSVEIGSGARIPASSFIFRANSDQSELYQSELTKASPLLNFQIASAEVVGKGASDCFVVPIPELPRSIQQYLSWPGLLRSIRPKQVVSQMSRSRTVSGMRSAGGDKETDVLEESIDRNTLNMLDSEQTIKLRDSELNDAVDRTIREKLSADNAILEVNSIKHAYGVGIRELTTSVIRAVLTVPLRNSSISVTDANLLTHVIGVLSNPHVLPLAKHYVRSREAQIDCLTAVEMVATKTPSYLVNLSGILQQLHSVFYLIEDDSVNAWFATVPAASGVKKAAQLFVTWMEMAEEESDDDDEDDESDE